MTFRLLLIFSMTAGWIFSSFAEDKEKFPEPRRKTPIIQRNPFFNRDRVKERTAEPPWNLATHENSLTESVIPEPAIVSHETSAMESVIQEHSKNESVIEENSTNGSAIHKSSPKGTVVHAESASDEKSTAESVIQDEAAESVIRSSTERVIRNSTAERAFYNSAMERGLHNSTTESVIRENSTTESVTHENSAIQENSKNESASAIQEHSKNESAIQEHSKNESASAIQEHSKNESDIDENSTTENANHEGSTKETAVQAESPSNKKSTTESVIQDEASTTESVIHNSTTERAIHNSTAERAFHNSTAEHGLHNATTESVTHENSTTEGATHENSTTENATHENSTTESVIQETSKNESATHKNSTTEGVAQENSTECVTQENATTGGVPHENSTECVTQNNATTGGVPHENSTTDVAQENSTKANSTKVNSTKKLNIHLIPHSHLDVGWLRTFDQYYYDSRDGFELSGAKYIFDSVVKELSKDPSRTFVCVEISFFSKWWKEQSDQIKATVRKLVDNKQFEFANGGWCANDEATAYYEDVIDQMTLGHKFIMEEFGVLPKIAWHLDSFGHSASQAAIFSQMGFDAVFFARIDSQDKNLRLANRNLELIWNPPQAGGQSNAIFAHILYNHYEAPPGFCFDIFCRDRYELIEDNSTVWNYNVHRRSQDFVNYFKEMAPHFKSDTDIMHTMGSDFSYTDAEIYFKNMDKLIKFINAHDFGVNIFYSTPSKYIEKINQGNQVYQEKNDDFFPYSDNDNAYWTGYFVSRIAIKGYVRELGRFLQSARTFYALLSLSSGVPENKSKEAAGAISELEQAMAIVQHHDAITGTHKQAVGEDYISKLNKAEGRVLSALNSVIYEKNSDLINETLEYYHCHWNETNKDCPNTTKALLDGKNVLLTIYNPTVTRGMTIRIKVPSAFVSVIDSQNRPKDSEVICNETETEDCDLFFYTDLDGFSFNYFKILTGNHSNKIEAENPCLSNTFEIDEDRSITVSPDKQNFLLAVCKGGKTSCKDYKFKLSYEHYESDQGSDIGQKSGLYIFRPNAKTLSGSIAYSTPEKLIIHQGKIVTQITVIADRTITRIRFFQDKVLRNGCEIETFVDSIPILDDQGKEIVMKVRSDQIDSGKTFYTDSQGLDLQKRVLNFRPTWNLTVHQPASGNYYPINGMIAIKDEVRGEMMTLLNDRSQGGSSLNSGEIEIMIHRRLLRDDNKGVGEDLNELENGADKKGLRQRMRHYLVFSSNEYDARRVQLYVDLRPVVFLAETRLDKFLQSPEPAERLINKNIEIPQDAKLYLTKLKDSKYSLRVQNMNPINETVIEIPFELTEMSMSAYQPLSSVKQDRLKWSSNKSGDVAFAKEEKKNYLEIKDISEDEKTTRFNLLPLQLRTFEFSDPKTG